MKKNYIKPACVTMKIEIQLRLLVGSTTVGTIESLFVEDDSDEWS